MQLYQDRWHLIGSTSYSGPDGCALPNFPTIFTRTSAYFDWICATAPMMDQCIQAQINITNGTSTISTTHTCTCPTANLTEVRYNMRCDTHCCLPLIIILSIETLLLVIAVVIGIVVYCKKRS